MTGVSGEFEFNAKSGKGGIVANKPTKEELDEAEKRLSVAEAKFMELDRLWDKTVDELRTLAVSCAEAKIAWDIAYTEWKEKIEGVKANG